MTYLGCFLISSVFFIFADITNNQKKGKASIFFALFGAFLLCLFASLRHFTIGTDVTYYVTPFFTLARNTSIAGFFKSEAITGEFLFYFILYYTAHVGDTIAFSLFVIEALIIVPLLFVWFKFKNKIKLSALMIVFMLLFYNFSFSIMRQIIACSFLLLATIYIIEKKYYKCIIFCLIALNFHASSIIYILFLVINKFIKKGIPLLLGVLGLLVIMFLFEPILTSISNAGIIPSYYLDRFIERKDENSINITGTILWTLIYLYSFFGNLKWKSIFRKETNLIIIFGFILLFGTMISSSIYRISFYFKYVLILTIPLRINEKNNFDRGINIFINLMVLALLFSLWFYYVIVCNYFDTYPYYYQWEVI